jgi:hypothetical protein
MTVDVKLNNLTWLLTGRSAGYVCPLLNTYVTVPLVDDPRVTQARQLLKLDVKGTDFFTYGALASIYSSLYYTRYLDVEQQAAFVPSIIPVTYSGVDVYQRLDGELVYVGGSPQAVARSNAWEMLPYYDASSLSVIRNKINWEDPHDSVKLDFETVFEQLTTTKYWRGVAGKSVTLDVVPDDDGVVRVDLMEFAGIRAAFQVDLPTHSFVNTPPVHYPYDEVRDKVLNETKLLQLMNDMGTLAAFHEATSGITSIGALASAIVLKAREYGTGPSYEVEVTANQVPGVPVELHVPVTFGAVEVETPCNE